MKYYSVMYDCACGRADNVIVSADCALYARNYFMRTGAKWVDGINHVSIRPATADDFYAGTVLLYIATSKKRGIATIKNYVRYMTGGNYEIGAIGGYAGGY